jgi:hypothetical protein
MILYIPLPLGMSVLGMSVLVMMANVNVVAYVVVMVVLRPMIQILASGHGMIMKLHERLVTWRMRR